MDELLSAGLPKSTTVHVSVLDVLPERQFPGDKVCKRAHHHKTTASLSSGLLLLDSQKSVRTLPFSDICYLFQVPAVGVTWGWEYKKALFYIRSWVQDLPSTTAI